MVSTLFKSGLGNALFKSDLKNPPWVFFVGTLFKLDLKSALVQIRNTKKRHVDKTHYESRHAETHGTTHADETIILREHILRKHILRKHM